MSKKLNDFTWDDSFGEEFGEQIKQEFEEEEQEELDFSQEQEEEEEEKPADKKKKTETEEVNEEDYEFDFGSSDEDDEDEEEEDLEEGVEEEEQQKDSKQKTKKPAEKAKVSKLNSKGVVSFLKEKGLVELEEDLNFDEMSDEEVEDQLEDIIEASNENYFKSQIEGLPSIAKNLLKVAVNGGDVGKYLSTVSALSGSQLKKGMDLSSEATQEKVMRNLLALEGKDAEDIEHEIEFLKSKDRLSSVAERRYSKWEEKVEKEEKELVAREAQAKKLSKENTRKFRSNLSEFLSKNKEVANLSISISDKRELPSYIANPAYETENGKAISEFQKDLFEAMKDNKKVVALAKILKSDFDFSAIVSKGANQAIKDVKNKLQHQAKAPTKRKRQTRNLIDFLDDM